jgi:dihydroflavonol-4-reductase
MQKTILLTGISGFIAKHIAVKLLRAGYNLRGSLRDLGRATEVWAALAPYADHTNLSIVQLDLTNDDHWVEAMEGVTALIHCASPFPLDPPKTEHDLIIPAVDGTLRAITSAYAAGVRRAIITSSTVAITDIFHRGSMDETTWCDPNAIGTSAYAKSKTLAERAAWDFAIAKGMELTTINPGFVVGPPLDGRYGSSVSLIARLLRGKDRMVPNISLPLVDVRDVAEAHLRALERPQTAGQRLPCVAGTMAICEMGHVLKSAYPNRPIPTRIAPKFILQALALFDPKIRAILPELGRNHQVSCARTRDALDLRFISAEGALRATAEWLIAYDQV